MLRIIRAALAAMICIESVRTGQWLLLIPGVIFALQAIFNVGCCAGGACATPARFDSKTQDDKVDYEEVR